MPRKARVDYPGALHHIIGRGIERRFVLASSEDKLFFLERLRAFCQKFDFRCYAWCLMDNHYHLLLETGSTPLCKLMSSLLTGYALFYNRSHDRVGHVFQNRYQSILCEKDAYLLELVRYIHLNPVKAGSVQLDALKRYQWCGHHEIVGYKHDGLIDSDSVLGHFGVGHKQSVDRYIKFLQAGPRDRHDFEGGGLHRSLGVGNPSNLSGLPVDKINFDQRILGGSHFVKQVLSGKVSSTPNFRTESFESIANKVKTYYGIEYEDLFIRRLSSPYREAQVTLIYLAYRYSSVKNQTQLGAYFGIGRTAVSMTIMQGRQLCHEKALEKAILTI